MNSLAFFTPANDRQIKKARFYRTSPVYLRLCKLPASEIPPFSRGHENGSNVVIKNKGAIVLWVKMAKNKVPECSPVQNGAYPESLTHSYYTRKEDENGKPNGSNICQVLF